VSVVGETLAHVLEPRADSVTKSSGKAGVAAVRETLEGAAMPTRKSARKTVTREPTPDAIRIVPLYVSAAVAKAATAHSSRIEMGRF